MSTKTSARPFPWVAVSAGALLAVVVVVALVRSPALPSADDPQTTKSVELLPLQGERGERGATEGMGLRDPVPLYLPTQMSAGHSEALSAGRRLEPVAAFRNYPANLNFPEAALRVDFPVAVPVPSNATEAIDADRGRHAFQYFGRRDLEVARPVSRLGFLEVARADDGVTVLAAELPAVSGAPEADWGPVDMVVAVNAAGLVGLPVVTQSSGSARLDGWLPGYLAQSFRIGQRLSPGIYRISLGP